MVGSKDPQGNLKPQVSLNQTEIGPGSGNFLKNIFQSDQGIWFRVDPCRGIETFFSRISGINLHLD